MWCFEGSRVALGAGWLRKHSLVVSNNNTRQRDLLGCSRSFGGWRNGLSSPGDAWLVQGGVAYPCIVDSAHSSIELDCANT
jgi:hypothetical protein